uniref:Glutathione S-transferase n=1 Tax=Oryza barthii TaxID=65489 RepID=A0A0D3HFX3_9ORYZ
MAGDGELKLLGMWTSAFVLRVRFVLNLKSLPYEFVEENLGDKSDLLLASNPVNKTVPVLLHAGRPVNESQVILQYIDEAWPDRPPAVLPSDPYERAVARFWAAYVDDKVRLAWLGILFRSETEEERAAAVAQADAALETLEGALREMIDPARTPALAAWEDLFRATDAARGVLPDDADKMLEFRQTALALGASKKITL